MDFDEQSTGLDIVKEDHHRTGRHAHEIALRDAVAEAKREKKSHEGRRPRASSLTRERDEKSDEEIELLAGGEGAEQVEPSDWPAHRHAAKKAEERDLLRGFARRHAREGLAGLYKLQRDAESE
eukprot:tig00000114_g6053.t1